MAENPVDPACQNDASHLHPQGGKMVSIAGVGDWLGLSEGCDYSQISGLHGNKVQTSGEYRFCFPKLDIQRLGEQLRGFAFGTV